MRTAFLLLALVPLLGLCAARADAHAQLERTNPPVGGSVSRSPPEIRLSFSENLEPRFSRAQLANSAGTIVSASSFVDRRNPNELVLRVPPLKPGRYKVIWRVISVDTHATEGDFAFDVKP